MANYGDFSSLLQLGVGIGIGISLFRAPVDLRVARISRTIDADLIALRGLATPFAKAKRRDMMDLRLRFVAVGDNLNRWMVPFMAAAVTAAVLNLAGLILATLCADQVASTFEIQVLLFVTVGWFVIELVALEVLARWSLRSIVEELDRIRMRKAPAIQAPIQTIPPSGTPPDASRAL